MKTDNKIGRPITVYARTFNEALDLAKQSLKEIGINTREIYAYKGYDLSTSAEIKDYSGRIIGHINMGYMGQYVIYPRQ